METKKLTTAGRMIVFKSLAISKLIYFALVTAQPAITCSKLTIESLEQGVKYVQ